MTLTSLTEYLSLSHYQIIEAIGPEAEQFLQNQLTDDVVGLGSEHARYMGYCTANGRLLATPLVWQHPIQESVYLLVHRSLTDVFLKRLKMFVLRAKVDLQVSTMHVYGAYGAISEDTISAPYAVSQDADHFIIQAPSLAGHPSRFWVVANEIPTPIPVTDDPLRVEQWEAEQLQAGMATLCLATQDAFIPQSLNMELIGAVNFQKGCFPGQEVVARSHYRGTIRRRCALFSVDSEAALPFLEEIQPGKDLYALNSDNEPRARIVNVAVTADKVWIMAEVQLGELKELVYTLHNSSGPQLMVVDLPYDIYQQRQNVRPKL